MPTGCVPRQIEFSRLNLQYTVLSKRKLIQLVREGHVHGWDDPRMPTLVGLRRRGMPPEAIRLFVERTGVSKAENNIDYAVLEDCARASLDAHAPRVMAVLEPLKVWGERTRGKVVGEGQGEGGAGCGKGKCVWRRGWRGSRNW